MSSLNAKSILLKPVGTVHSARKDVVDDDWDQVNAFVELEPGEFSADALVGLSDFSHVEILFYLNQVEAEKVETGARRPRGNVEWPKVGIFAQRGKNRPNQIGATICRILKVEGTRLYLEGLDAVDQTPVLDVKPWVHEFGPRGAVFQPKWIAELMKSYWRTGAAD